MKTAGSGYIRALTQVCDRDFDEFLTIYIDDLLITSTSFEQHLGNLQAVFTRFLGFVLSVEGIRPTPDGLKVIEEFAEPSNKKQLQAFIGVCTYYRQFSVRHANYIDPFRSLLKDKVEWKWTIEHSQAFRDLKKNFANSVLLSHVMPNRPFKLQADASNRGLCGVLYQVDDEDNHHIITLVSRCLNSAEINYGTTEKELLAIFYAVTKCRTYLIGGPFEIITDHKGLSFLNSTQYHTARLIRWCLILQQYTFTVRYCTGRDNLVADFFSRNPSGRFEAEASRDAMVSMLTTLPIYLSPKVGNLSIARLSKDIDPLPAFLKRDLMAINKSQSDDHHLAGIREQVAQGLQTEHYCVHNDILFRLYQSTNRWLLVLPKTLIPPILAYFHGKLGHPGSSKTLSYIRGYSYWDNMSKHIKEYVRTCGLCQRTKSLNYSMQGRYQLISAKKPGDLVTVDFYVPLPRAQYRYQYIFVVLDAFSKYVKLYPIQHATTRAVLNTICQ